MRNKHIIGFCLFSFFSLKAWSQENIFILVDVSKSVNRHQLEDARQALTEVLMGTSLSKAFVSQGNVRDLLGFKVTINDKVDIEKFGSLSTTVNMNMSPVIIHSLPGDIYQATNNFPLYPTDDRTYLVLAKAKIAAYAKKRGINQYRLCLISDNTQDDYGPNGKSDYPDDATRNLVESYNTTTNPVIEPPSTKLKFAAGSDFTLTFTRNVDLTKYTPPLPGQGNNSNGSANSLSQQDSSKPTPPVIKLVSFPGGKKGAPKEVNTNTFNVSWNCPNCPPNTNYTVGIFGYDGNKYKEVKNDQTSNTTEFSKVSDGKYRVSVSAQGVDIGSDTTYIEVSTGGSRWIIALVLLLAAGGAGYYWWNKKRQQKIETATDADSTDIFSFGSTSSHT